MFPKVLSSGSLNILRATMAVPRKSGFRGTLIHNKIRRQVAAIKLLQHPCPLPCWVQGLPNHLCESVRGYKKLFLILEKK
jgi:hypothetical protein